MHTSAHSMRAYICAKYACVYMRILCAYMRAYFTHICAHTLRILLRILCAYMRAYFARILCAYFAHICAHTLRIYARIVCAYMRAYLIFFGGYGRILGGRIPPVCAHIWYAWKPYYKVTHIEVKQTPTTKSVIYKFIIA